MNIGIDIGGSHIGIGLISKENPSEILILKNKYFNSVEKKSEENMLEAIKLAITENLEKILIEQGITLNEIETIGIGIPGKVMNNEVRDAKNLKISYFSIGNFFKIYFDEQIKLNRLNEDKEIKVLTKNDNEAAAICEKQLGSLKEYDDCVFLGLGTGIGSTVFIDNKILTPKKARGFELGHMTIVVGGKSCKCGKNGCFEQYCSMHAFMSEVNEILKINNILFDKDDLYFFDKHYNLLKDIINNFTKYLAIGLINIIDIFEPQAICFGGGFAKYKDGILFKKLQEYLEKTPKFSTDLPDIVISRYGNESGVIGSVLEK